MADQPMPSPEGAREVGEERYEHDAWRTTSTECYCGSELKLIPLPERLRLLSGENHIYVHIHNGDTRCYPDSRNAEDAKATGEPCV